MKRRLSVRRTAAAAVTVVAVALGMIAGAPIASASPAGGGAGSDALVQPNGARAAALASLVSLASATGGTTVTANGNTVRCAPVDRIFYCLGLGWRNALPTAEEVAFEPAHVAGVGTKGLASSAQAAQDRQEIADALEGVDDVLYYKYLSDGVVPAATVAAFPALAALSGGASPAAACPTIVVQGAATAAACPTAPSQATVGSTSKALKQKNSWYCGPTSMAILGWNDPQVGNVANYRNPDYWAPLLGTTQANGTAIVNINSQINAKLTGWKSLNGRAYQVVDVSGWSLSTWASMFKSHIGLIKALVQLHPWLPSLNYWPSNWSAGGHFDVGRGYNFSSASSANWTVNIFEPAGGSSMNAIMDATLTSVRQAHLDHPLHNISY